MGREHPSPRKDLGSGAYRGEQEPSAGRHNCLQRGVKVRMLRDHITLKKGDIGEVVGVLAWVGKAGCLVDLSFRNGDTRFSQSPRILHDLVEVVQ